MGEGGQKKEKKADEGVEQMDRNEVTDVRRPGGMNANIRSVAFSFVLYFCKMRKEGCHFLFDLVANSVFHFQWMKACSQGGATFYLLRFRILQTQSTEEAAIGTSIQNVGVVSAPAAVT